MKTKAGNYQLVPAVDIQGTALGICVFVLFAGFCSFLGMKGGIVCAVTVIGVSALVLCIRDLLLERGIAQKMFVNAVQTERGLEQWQQQWDHERQSAAIDKKRE